MNTTTQQVIEFLTHPELPFGAEDDLLLLSDPQALQTQVASLLEDNPTVLGHSNSQNLKAQLANADWPLVAQEFQARVTLASKFFEADLENSNSSDSR